jgi:hypothetical protein
MQRAKISAWRDEYNGEWPHSSLGAGAPNEFAAILKSSRYDWLKKARQINLLHHRSSPARLESTRQMRQFRLNRRLT